MSNVYRLTRNKVVTEAVKNHKPLTWVECIRGTWGLYA